VTPTPGATPHLFSPLTLRSVTVKNRIMLSPMCQYSAVDGVMTDWHMVHLGARAAGGAGIVFTEATGTEPRGRISPQCPGLWNDEQRDRMRRITDFISAQGAVPGIQLAHAGRKASTARPSDGGQPIAVADGGWEVIGPSPIPFAPGYPVPVAMTLPMIREFLDGFAQAARRAREAGFRIVEIHAAHGYLLQQFLSPLSNQRDDEYGGSRENRMRLVLETAAAARSEWPAELPLFLRISSTDWVPGGWTLDDSLALARAVKAQGAVDLIDCSSGGASPLQQIPLQPGYQVPFAAAIRAAAGIPTGAVGLIHSADFAASIVANGQADLVILGRKLLADPVWPLRAARELRAAGVQWPVPYERGASAL
jgi:2,4-dienoyl-CoA reductase-like NADH-dependent reductase (Old Yellow Enzyme family)